MGGPRWQMVPVPSLIINVVITTSTSLLLLKVINVLTNFYILSDILLFKYFLLYGYFEGNSDNAMNSTIWRHNDNITSLCRSRYALLLEVMSSLICV